FDLLFEHDVDLRRLALSERQRDLARLCNKARKEVPSLFLVESFPECEPLLEWCEHYQLEGIVSKRLSSRYSSGTCRDWQKTKTEGWREANQFRHKLFEGHRREEPDPSERDLKKKKAELARVLECLEQPASPRMTRELKKQAAILEAQIAELER